MNSWLYSEKVKDHFMNPRNIMFDDEDFEYDAVGKTGNIKCGDEMIFYLKIDPETLSISDCRWKTFGCASAIASTSVLSEMIKGMTLDDVYNISNVDIMEELGGLPDNKVHCSVLGDKALQEAINNYYNTHGMEDKVHDTESRIVCECLDVSEEEIEHAVLEGARNYYQLQEMTKVGTSCGKCEEDARERLGYYLDKHFGIKEIN
ncbi:MAG: iron-sulfur cluster assembly scaffold protein [Candidatus Aegiribacteria sp.]|nr:iron-sulfur cluster assembly scaffold protein [Candidatus Aegiribacteria sp.]